MIVYLRVEDYSYEMGDPTWFRNFFDNVVEYVENGDYGSVCPNLRNFYENKELPVEKLEDLKKELLYVKEVFSKIDVQKLVWRVYKQGYIHCPYLDNLADDIFTLADFWRTSHEAKDMFDVVCVAIEDAKEENEKLWIEYAKY